MNRKESPWATRSAEGASRSVGTRGQRSLVRGRRPSGPCDPAATPGPSALERGAEVGAAAEGRGGVAGRHAKKLEYCTQSAGGIRQAELTHAQETLSVLPAPKAHGTRFNHTALSGPSVQTAGATLGRDLSLDSPVASRLPSAMRIKSCESTTYNTDGRSHYRRQRAPASRTLKKQIAKPACAGGKGRPARPGSPPCQGRRAPGHH